MKASVPQVAVKICEDCKRLAVPIRNLHSYRRYNCSCKDGGHWHALYWELEEL